MNNIYLQITFDLIHMLATIAWFGAIITLNVMVRPAMMKTLQPQEAKAFMRAMLKKTRVVVYVSLLLLFITGIPMKIASEHYVSIINFSNDWQIVMFIKHVFVGILALLAFFNFEYLAREFQKLASKDEPHRLKQLTRLQALSGTFSMLLAFLIILLSAVVNYL
jgi:uncharacterized membrane protein